MYTPAQLNASILDWAVPFLPDTIAPACPILLPFGAETPAINAEMGFLIDEDSINLAAASSAVPPIAQIIKIPFVSSSFKNKSKQSMKFIP